MDSHRTTLNVTVLSERGTQVGPGREEVEWLPREMSDLHQAHCFYHAIASVGLFGWHTERHNGSIMAVRTWAGGRMTDGAN